MDTSDTRSLTSGIHHLGLTVPSLASAVEFFTSTLGFRLVKERPDYPAAFVSDGQVMLTLWQVQSQYPTAFDRKTNIGLHHFALTLAEGISLDEVAERLRRRDDVEIEFMPAPLGPGPTRHLMCTVAGGLRMEVISVAG